jgi:hypothetical protein
MNRADLKRWCWLILGDVRNAAVSAIFAAGGAFLGTVYAQSQEATRTFVSKLTEGGVGYPAILFADAAKEDGLQVEFSPKELQSVAVCEYFSDKKRSLRAIMDQYLERNSSCFIPIWKDEKKLEIRPNTHAGQLKETIDKSGQKHYWCKCASSQIPSE